MEYIHAENLNFAEMALLKTTTKRLATQAEPAEQDQFFGMLIDKYVANDTETTFLYKSKTAKVPSIAKQVFNKEGYKKLVAMYFLAEEDEANNDITEENLE